MSLIYNIYVHEVIEHVIRSYRVNIDLTLTSHFTKLLLLQREKYNECDFKDFKLHCSDARFCTLVLTGVSLFLAIHFGGKKNQISAQCNTV